MRGLVLNRFFTQYIFKELIDMNMNSVYKTIINDYVKDSDKKNNSEIIKDIYSYMLKYYRNEYIYQNTIINKLLLGKHSLNTTTALTQIPISKSKADFILINGKAVVYEIKSELDTLERLDKQIKDYYKAFKYVTVISCEENFNKLCDLYGDTKVGISIFTKRNTISNRKVPICEENYLDYKVIYDVLNKKEIDEILLSYYKKLPTVSIVFYYKVCYELFKKIPMNVLYTMFLKQLKKRNQIDENIFSKIPYELKSLIYFAKISYKDISKLEKFLNSSYGG